MALAAGFRIQALGASRGTVTWPIAPRRHANTRRMTSGGMAGGLAFDPAVPGLAPWGLYGCKGRDGNGVGSGIPHRSPRRKPGDCDVAYRPALPCLQAAATRGA